MKKSVSTFIPHMHENALRDLQIARKQKPKFSVTCLSAFFVKSVPVPPEHEKHYIDVSLPGGSEMHYVAGRSHRMQKHKVSVACLDVLFVESVPVPPEHEN
jgi:hypothetical protein